MYLIIEYKSKDESMIKGIKDNINKKIDVDLGYHSVISTKILKEMI